MQLERPPTCRRIATIALGLAVALAPAARADDPAAAEFFEAKVRPILVERCQGCHGAEKAKGGLRLDSRAAMLAGGDSGSAVVAGKPAESPLVAAIGYAGDVTMPPKSKLPDAEIATLTRWVESGAAWPSSAGGAGAAAGRVRPFDLAERAKHWSLQPVRPQAPPAVRDASWPANDLDRFLLAKLEAAGLAPAGDADRATLIRRATFDLIGLPPQPAEVAAFEADPAPTAEAFGRVVDRLLASPHHGERWARHWMDLVRFAETSGHEFDYDIPFAHRYRDYLIRAFNADLPYDRFVVEQVAGDLLPEPRRDPGTGTDESTLATGFYRLHEGTHSPVDLREDRATRVDNQVDVLGKTFLGLTIACARCHDHKFDAITTKDYYALAGYLASSRHALAFLDPPGKDAAALDELANLRRRLAALLPPAEATPTPATPGGEVFETFDRPHFAPWTATGPAFGVGPTGIGSVRVEGDRVAPLPPGLAHSGAIADRLRGAIRSPAFTIARGKVYLRVAGRGGRVNVVVEGFDKIRSPIYGGLVVDVQHGDALRWIAIDVAQWAGLPAYLEIDDGATVDFTGNTGVVRDGSGWVAVDEVRFGDGPAPADAAPSGPTEPPAAVAPLAGRYRAVVATLGDATLGQCLIAGTGVDTRVHVRGSVKNLGEPVPRRFLEVLGGTNPGSPGEAFGSDRLDLARRIADPANPLTVRVLVNRLWHHHFGRGIVASVDDFGVMGREPTHPELLDYLADRFVASGWSVKAMHRLILTSHAYRMASTPEPEADRLDAGNALWNRRDLHRLDAESIRDAILAVSGRLDPTLGGPSVPPHLTPFMAGRGRPGHSGPLDGAGRRSIYLNVRRNFVSPLLLAFDFPTPSAPMGRRNTSNVPAQALTLLNDPFVLDQARAWGARVAAVYTDPDPAPGIAAMYREAFGRAPSAEETTAAAAFLAEGHASGDAPTAWADLAHVLFNAKEFFAVP